MRRRTGNVNGVDIKLLVERGSAFRSFNPLRLHGDFSYLLFKSDNDII